MIPVHGTRIYPKGYEPQDEPDYDPGLRNQLLDHILSSASEADTDTDMFRVMARRRSTRRFSKRPVEAVKMDRIIAAADTAPTAGNYQGFEIFYVRDPKVKKGLVAACNGQKYVDAPAVLVFCKNPARVKFDFEQYVLTKFAIQDATLAAAYSQLAAQALGLSSIWIGMLDERAVMEVIGTDLVPSSILCIGYPEQSRYPKPRRNLKDLVHVV
ncbi:MAG: nitroreductase family protein [Nitrosopumilus sp.]|nr:nitroreductase family protein [Nitrosopumilus sp.]CAI9831450.1 Nitroreductase family protein [Nitrosopumilaceae archaeon]MDA7940820.1 nitroreductase family protein [Nitrosopumilus sp.]MDA7943324.1 nitroreductase family protein [Nitrosopumilus sp.]MDA7945693.1 nitroreductase family protein [Nitrosopumilus sp.]